MNPYYRICTISRVANATYPPESFKQAWKFVQG